MIAAMASSTALAAVAVEQFEEAPLAGLDRGDLRAQIAHRAVRHAHVHADDVDQVLVDAPALCNFRIGICRPSE